MSASPFCKLVEGSYLLSERNDLTPYQIFGKKIFPGSFQTNFIIRHLNNILIPSLFPRGKKNSAHCWVNFQILWRFSHARIARKKPSFTRAFLFRLPCGSVSIIRLKLDVIPISATYRQSRQMPFYTCKYKKDGDYRIYFVLLCSFISLRWFIYDVWNIFVYFLIF